MKRTVVKVPPKIPVLPRPKRVAAYARVSCGKDAMLHSLSTQISHYSRLIQNSPGWQYCGVFADEAITGTKDTRENFQKLLAACRAGELDMIITKSISRFARNTVVLLEMVRELKQLSVDVFFEEQNIHTISTAGELMMTILASYAQEESRSASENQKWRIRYGFQKGELMCLRDLYGYCISPGKIEINPVQAEVVSEIYASTIAGESLASIAQKLNNRGVFGLLGGRWTARQIHDLLANEKYTGNALLQKEYRNNHLEKKKVKNNGELPMYYAEGTHEAIVDMATFEQAQAVLKSMAEKTHSRQKPIKTAFSRLIRCGKCGAFYRRCTSGGIVFWNCSTYMGKGKAACPGCRIHEDMLRELTAGVSNINGISEITAKENMLTFCLKDGSVVSREWQLRSRSNSWTPEMKTRAKEAAKRRGS